MIRVKGRDMSYRIAFLDCVSRLRHISEAAGVVIFRTLGLGARELMQCSVPSFTSSVYVEENWHSLEGM